MRRAIFVLLGLGLMLGTSSCLLAEPPSAHMTAIPEDDFCTRFAQTMCDGFDHCCDDPAVRAAAPDRATCVQMVQHDCTNGAFSLSVWVHDPRTGYDPFYGGAVLQTMQDYIARCDPRLVAFTNRRDGLASALRGTVANGAACLDGQEAASNLTALLSCEDFSRACILRDTTHGECTMRHGAGDTCVTGFDCREGLYCTGLIGGRCQALLPNGGNCMPPLSGPQHAWCESTYCYMGHCDTPTRTHVYCGGGIVPTMM